MTLGQKFMRARALLPFVDRSGNGCVLIGGSGRSGTTWLTELVAGRSGTRVVFEPFKPGVSDHSDQFWYRQFMSLRDNNHPSADAVKAILKAEYRSRWTDRYNAHFVYEHRVIKAIRANLSLAWIERHCPHTRLAFVIRNPIDVVASQARGGWPLNLPKLVQQEDLVTEFLEPFLPLIEACKEGYQADLVHWCIENHVPLRQFASLTSEECDRVRIFGYDRLRTSQAELAEFLVFCGVEDHTGILANSGLPSRVTRQGTNLSKARAHSAPPEGEAEFTAKTLEAFGLAEWWLR